MTYKWGVFARINNGNGHGRELVLETTDYLRAREYASKINSGLNYGSYMDAIVCKTKAYK